MILVGWASNCVLAGQPDVLMIAVDDLNDWTGHLGGHPQARTPNIDALVGRGIDFTNAHCAAPACNPSRAALMSGRRPHQSGIYVNGQPAGPVLRETITLNRHFLSAGYNVRGGGKIYHGYGSEGRDDTWTLWHGNPKTTGPLPENLNGLGKSHFDWGAIDKKTSEMGDAKLTDWAVETLQTAPRDQPLFLAVGYVKPHLPWHVPAEYFERFPLEEVQLPEVLSTDLDDVPAAGVKMAGANRDHASVIKDGQWRHAVQGYLATISFLDDQVGRLMRGLDASGRADNTIIVWWTDHGWHLGEKQHWRKFALWRDATRVGLSITAPGVSQAGLQCDAPVDLMSIYPTLCELTGLPTPSHVQAPSLQPLLQNPTADWDHTALCTHDRGNHAVYNRTHHLIQYRDGTHELYDFISDPNEWRNLANDPASEVTMERLRARLPEKEAASQPTQRRKRK